jgi:methylated-DNA-[protein]-cysteine S-methyltransferase
MTLATDGAVRSHTVIGSPIGPLTLVAADGKLTGVYMDTPGHRPRPESLGEPAGPAASPASPASRANAELLAEAARQFAAYFAGQRTSFDLPVALEGTGFQRKVWAALQQIGYGETVSYRELARRIGQPTASRAVGLANGANPVAIVVPCHRVIGADGSLTGYGGGLDRKRYLLALEQRVTGQTLA